MIDEKPTNKFSVKAFTLAINNGCNIIEAGTVALCYFSLTLVIQVKNIGSNESNLTNWSLDFFEEDREKFEGEPIYQRNTIYIDYPETKIAFPVDKALYNLTENPIKPGETVAGVIQFQFPTKFNQEFQLILKARDNKDKEFNFKISSKEFNKKQTEFIAGMHDIIINSEFNSKISN